MVSAEISPEALAKLSKFIEAGPASGCAGGCGGCLAPCRPQTVEFGKNVLSVHSLTEVPAGFKGIIFPVSQGSGGPPVGTRIETSEKTCSECNKPTSTCTCR